MTGLFSLNTNTTLYTTYLQALCELYDRPAEIWAFDPTVGARKLRTFHETLSTTTATGGSTGGCSGGSMRTTSTTTSISSQLQPQERREATVTDVRALPSTSTSSPTATTAGVIRLSYYGGGHYDSVVSPLHSDGVTKLPPGEIENARIVRTIHTHTTRRHIEQQQQHHTSSNSSTTGTNNSTTNTIANLEREELEKQHLDQAIQESRRCYLNTAYNDLETCLLQQYASNIDNLSHNMTSIPTKTQYYKENLEENAQPEWNEHPDRKEDPEEGIINMIQKQSENEYYEKEIITSLQNETKYTINNNDSTSHNTTTNKEEESDLIDAELMSHIRQESENEAKRKENELIEAALLESTKLSSSNNSGGGCVVRTIRIMITILLIILIVTAIILIITTILTILLVPVPLLLIVI